MKKVGIFIDSWKIDIFNKMLTEVGLTYTKELDCGFGEDITMLKIEIESDRLMYLEQLVRQTNLECKK
jgi:hypothetical protein